MKRTMNGDLALCGVFAAFILLLCTQMPKIKANARIYPLVLMILSLVFMTIVIIQALRKRAAAKAQGQTEPTPTAVSRYRTVVYCLLILAYIVLIPLLGYVLSTIAFAVVSLLYQKKKNLSLLILLPVISALLMYIVFKQYLFVTLPTGALVEAVVGLF